MADGDDGVVGPWVCCIWNRFGLHTRIQVMFFFCFLKICHPNVFFGERSSNLTNLTNSQIFVELKLETETTKGCSEALERLTQSNAELLDVIYRGG